ncbi:olfactory receptor-like protein DTMT [Megalops cyprinoides]|uniref:olfactory receptor-like protein DTMT n=1 Tax=Megalops cyprinoides TaxID=118141 RepID=UPI001863DC10|nr:olfactory receptor-like protein DTMT [Megalops cyprinoides]
MLQGNQTTVKEFIILCFQGLQPQYYDLVATFFFFVYVTTVAGNSLLVGLFAIERSLHKPMYIIMLSLALSDIGFCTVALPRVIAKYWFNAGALSFLGCLLQKHLIHYFGTLNSLIMMTMSLDRYLAICFPLRYPMLMTNRTMGVLNVFAWASSMIAPGITTIQSSELPFCGPNKIAHCYCDTSSLNQQACADITMQSFVSFSLAMFVLLLPFSFIIFSYVNIIASVLRIADTQGRNKTFSTCGTQVCIISIYYIPRFSVYVAPFLPNVQITGDLRTSLVMFYSLFPPLVNPLIYCFRTKEIKEILRKWISRKQKYLSVPC